jgi:NhaP-type Na+/H+ or K+/H+ antiporter
VAHDVLVLATTWFVVIGALLIGMALAGSVLRRLPLTTGLLYLAVGAGLGPWGAELLHLDVLADAALLERLSEIAVIVSLFTAGLKLRLPLTDRRWRPPLGLATVAMVLTVAMVALLGTRLLGLSLGAAVLLGAVLAPTDPVLASDVQVAHAGDGEPLRFSLTGEAGLNDGTAFPFVMLGLGLLGTHDLGDGGSRWLAVDVGWAVVAGLAIGTLCGTAIGRLVIYLRREHREAVGLDEFLALGLISSSYGLALLAHAYGFLAVFAAGLAVRRIEREHAEVTPPADVSAAAHPRDSGPAEAGAAPGETASAAEAEEARATHPATAPAHMAEAVLGFNEQLERLGEFGVVLVLGALLATIEVPWAAVSVVALLLFAIRPLASWLTLARSPLSWEQRHYVAWFGVRGVGSLYYLTYAIVHGAPAAEARVVADVTLLAVAASIVLHGVSVTPLMRRYERGAARR